MTVVVAPESKPILVPKPDCGPYIPATGQPVGWTLIGEDDPKKTREITRKLPQINIMEDTNYNE